VGFFSGHSSFRLEEKHLCGTKEILLKLAHKGGDGDTKGLVRDESTVLNSSDEEGRSLILNKGRLGVLNIR